MMNLRKKYNKIKLLILAKRSGSLFLYIDTARRKTDKKTGTEWYRLKKMKENMRPIEFEHIIQNAVGSFALVYSPAKGEFYPMAFTDTYRDTIEYTEPMFEEKEFTEMQTVKRRGRLKAGDPREIEVPVTVKRMVPKVDSEGKPVFETKTVEVRGLIEPVNEDQKAFLITEMERAQMRHGKHGLWEKFGPLFSVMVCGIALALVFLFWAEAAKVVLAQSGTAINMLQEIGKLFQGVRPLIP